MSLSLSSNRQFLNQLNKQDLRVTRVLKQQTNHVLFLYTSFHLVF